MTVVGHYELNAVPYSERLAKQLESDFERDLAGCPEFNLAEYHEGNAALRVAEVSRDAMRMV